MTPYKANSKWAREYRDKRILELRDQGMSIWQIAQETHYAETTIEYILRYYKAEERK